MTEVREQANRLRSSALLSLSVTYCIFTASHKYRLIRQLMSHRNYGWGKIKLQMKPCGVLEKNEMVKMHCQLICLFCPGLASSSTVKVFVQWTKRGRRSCTTSRTRSTSLSSPPCRVGLIIMPSLVLLWH